MKKIAAQEKLEWMQREYWALRNERQDFMRCPYCAEPQGDGSAILHLNHPDDELFCCELFAKALKAILDRQTQVDIAAKSARDTIRLENMMAAQNGNRLVN